MSEKKAVAEGLRPSDGGWRPPDGGWGWMVVLGAMVIHLVHTGISVTFGVFYPALLERFQKSATLTSLILSIFNLFRMFMGPVGGALAERFGCRPVAMVGCIFATVGCAASAFAHQIEVVYIALGVITGFGCCVSFVPTYITVGRYFDKKKGKAMAIATQGNSLAPLIVAAVFTFLLEKFGYTGAMLLLAGFALHSLPACALYRPLTRPKSSIVLIVTPSDGEKCTRNRAAVSEDNCEGRTVPLQECHETICLSDKSVTENAHLNSSEIQNPVPKKRICKRIGRCIVDCTKQFYHLKSIPFLTYGLTMTGMTLSNNCLYAFLPALCLHKGLSQPQIALVFILSGSCDCLGRIIGGVLYDLKLIQPQRIWIQGIVGIITGVLTICIAIPALILPWTVILITCLRAVCIGVFNSQRMTVMADVVGAHKMAACVGLILWFQGIGNSFGILLAGVIKDRTDSFFAVYLYGGGVLAIFCAVYTTQHFILKSMCKQNH